MVHQDLGTIRFPKVPFVCAVILCTAVTIWLAWHSVYAYERAVESGERSTSFERTRGEIIHLDEVLTMSARMAAATGNLEWQKRYERAEPKLISAIDRAMGFSAQSVAPVTATQQANDKLVEIESRAFELIRSGQTATASAILQDNVYQVQKQIYAEGMQNFIDQLQTHLRDDRQAQRTSAVVSMVAASLSIVFTIGVWIYVFSRIRKWHALIASANEMRRRATEALADHRDRLQTLVDQATAKLKTDAEKLKQALAKEKELNEMQRQFVSMASHEFRTPLAIIDSTAQRLKKRADNDDPTPEDAARRVENIRRAVQRMTRLMESTLDAARMEDGQIAVEIDSCNVESILKEVCERQQELSSGHRIQCDLEGLPESIMADSGALEQVFTNLLSNAVKFAPDEPLIQVSARAEGDDVVITVRDYGLGIDDDDLPNLFGRFFRAKNSTGIAGTGIGLNLVQLLLEMHGGSIDVESRMGEGSMFVVRLPVSGPKLDMQNQTRAA